MSSLGIINKKSAVLEKFSSLYLDSNSSDIILSVNNEKIHAHRFVLAAHSNYFRESLLGANQLKFSRKDEVTIFASVSAFKFLLAYMYSGSMDLPRKNFSDVAEVLELCHRYEIMEVIEGITDYLCAYVTVDHAIKVYEVAKSLQIGKLVKQCWFIIQMWVEGLYPGKVELPLKFLKDLVHAEERYLTESRIFKAILSSHEANLITDDERNFLISRIQFERMSAIELVDIVEPSGVVDSTIVLHFMRTLSREQAQRIHDGMNLQNLKVKSEFGSEYIQAKGLQYASFELEKALIAQNNFILIDLGGLYSFNKVSFKLSEYDKNSRFRYFIEASKNYVSWTKIVDQTRCVSERNQNLYFPMAFARYLRIVGVECRHTKYFGLNSFEITFEENLPKALFAYEYPLTNVAVNGKATVSIVNSEGKYTTDTNLLTQNYRICGKETQFTAQKIKNGSLIICFKQPFLLDSCRFRFWDFDSRKYSFQVEVATDLKNKETSTLVHESKGFVDNWQVIKFSPRIVKAIKIRGLKATIGDEIRLVHFQAPAQKW